MKLNFSFQNYKNISKFGNFLFFLPAIFFFFTAIIVLVAPNFTVSIISCFCFLFGILSFALGLKLMSWKKKFSKLSQEFNNKIVVTNINMEEFNSDNNDNEINKKDFYH